MHDIATRSYVVALKSSGNMTTKEVAALTGLSERTIQDIFARAIKRGFDPAARPIVITDSMIADKAQAGRPTKKTAKVSKLVVDLIRRDRYGREKSCTDIAGDLRALGHT